MSGNASYHALNATHLFVDKVPLIIHGNINPVFLTDVLRQLQQAPAPEPTSRSVAATMVQHGAFSRRDINAGVLLLEVSEDGTYASFCKNNELVHELSSEGLHTVGRKHTLGPGVSYTLTMTENAIVEIDEDNRKYILTSKRK